MRRTFPIDAQLTRTFRPNLAYTIFPEAVFYWVAGSHKIPDTLGLGLDRLFYAQCFKRR